MILTARTTHGLTLALTTGLLTLTSACSTDTTTMGTGGSSTGGGSTGGSSTGDQITTATTAAEGTSTSASSGEVTATSGSTGTMTGGDTESGSSGTAGLPECDPDFIPLPGDMLYPEGVAAHSDGRLFVGSITSGAILVVTPCTEAGSGTDHVIETFNDGIGAAAVGMLVDETNDILWVCASDPLTGMNPTIRGFNLTDGTLAHSHPFSGGMGLCNDLAFDADHNLYATDSFAHRIRRVTVANLLDDSEATSWSNDSMYSMGVATGDFGLNGIAFDGTDTMYAVNYAANAMYAVVIDSDGTAIAPTAVSFGDATLTNPDGFKLESPGNFLAVSGGDAHALVRITLGDPDATITTISDALDGPTTLAIVDTHAWVLEGKLTPLFRNPMDPPSAETPFALRRISLR